MKRKKVMAVLFFAVALAGSSMTAGCGAKETGTAQTQEEVSTQAEAEQTAEEQTEAPAQEETAAEHTVTYYDSDGTTVLETKTAADGACAEEFTPEKAGETFVGWYATPQMSRKYDFGTQVKEDTALYAGFTSYVEDTRTFVIVGSGTGAVLAESDWGAVIGEAQTMTKEENDEANVYTITLDLEAGDQFQFAINGSWEDQRGFGYMTTIAQDGTEYFKNSGGIGETGAKKSNIEVAVSGNYTFTLTTYPGEDVYDTEDSYYTEETKENFNMNPYDTITWTYNGAATD